MSAETLPLDRIHGALEELEAQKSLITGCALLWQKISDHYSSLEKTLTERSQSLESKLQALGSETKQTLESLDRREASLLERESSAAALIEERRNAVIAEVENPECRPPTNLTGILRWYCRRMDAAGLWRFMMARRRELEVLRREISEAVAETVDPAWLVLDVVEDFMSNPAAAAAASVAAGGERCWAVGVLVKTLFDSDRRKAAEVSGSIRDRAAAVAEIWKEKHVGKKAGREVEEEEEEEEEEEGEEDKGGMEGAEARIFLRLVMAFGIRMRFEEDFLMKLVVENASRKEMAKHAARLGFGGKIEDIIELVKNGKEIEAIYFAHESGLADKFSPVPLLKSYLQGSRKNANAILRKGHHTAAASEESINFELDALKSIIKCVETLNLEQKFTLDHLKKRLLELEKTKSDKERKLESKKSQAKRTRVGGSSNFRPSKVGRAANRPYATYPRNPPPMAAQIPPAQQSYNYASQVGFDVPPATYGAAAHSRSPSMTQYYAPEEITGARGAMPYGAPSINYGSYDYTVAPLQPQYPH